MIKLSPAKRGDFNHAPTEWGGYSLGNAFCSHGTLLPWVLKFLNIELGLRPLFHVGGALCAATVAVHSTPPTKIETPNA